MSLSSLVRGAKRISSQALEGILGHFTQSHVATVTASALALDWDPSRSAVLAEFPAYLRMGRGSELLPIFLRLLQDPEADVRAQSCGFAKARCLAREREGGSSRLSRF